MTEQRKTEQRKTEQRKPSPPASDTAQQTTEEGRLTDERSKGPYVGRPLDGSQYVDVIEEQEYADRRPSPEEQKPRFSHMQRAEQQGNKQ